MATSKGDKAKKDYDFLASQIVHGFNSIEKKLDQIITLMKAMFEIEMNKRPRD